MNKMNYVTNIKINNVINTDNKYYIVVTTTLNNNKRNYDEFKKLIDSIITWFDNEFKYILTTDKVSIITGKPISFVIGKYDTDDINYNMAVAFKMAFS